MTARRRRLLARLARLRPGTTMCPGALARDCGATLAVIRPDLLELARAGRVLLTQRGEKVSGPEIRGPFRVRLS
jgi:hypothetical protein